MTHLRPDIVSARIAANLGIVQPSPVTTSATIPPINPGVPNTAPVQTGTVHSQAMPGVIPTSHAPTISKAQAIAQTVAPETSQPQNPTPINSAVAGLAALVKPSQANTQNPPAFTEEENFALNNSSNAPIAERIPNANVTAPPILPVL